MTKQTDPLHIISLGAGVQSSTLALMAACGEITPKPVAAIFSDTKAEPRDVYEWLDWLEQQLPFPVRRVTAGDLGAESIRVRVSKKTGQTYSRTLIPAFVAKPDGKKSLLGRKCTAEFKVRRLIKECRSIVGVDRMKAWKREHRTALMSLAKYKKEAKTNKQAEFPFGAWQECQNDALVHQWIGISLDEMQRMKESREPWIVTTYPLVQKRISREGCLAWMQERGYPRPPRSACKWCPFHDDDEWLRQKTDTPEEFAESCQFERDLNISLGQATGTARLAGPVFLHSSLVPLDEVVFKPKTKNGTRSLFVNECEGMCGV